MYIQCNHNYLLTLFVFGRGPDQISSPFNNTESTAVKIPMWQEGFSNLVDLKYSVEQVLRLICLIKLFLNKVQLHNSAIYKFKIFKPGISK